MSRSGDESSAYPDALTGGAAPKDLPRAPACPFCGGVETELVSAFGSHASLSTYWCRTCGSPFEMMKWRVRPG
jgi:transcription elongation factor Elf1